VKQQNLGSGYQIPGKLDMVKLDDILSWELPLHCTIVVEIMEIFELFTFFLMAYFYGHTQWNLV
jgi:hypothetical protein